MEYDVKYKGLKVKHMLHIANFDEESGLKARAELVAGICEIDKSIIYRMDNDSFQKLFNKISTDIALCLKEKNVKKVISVSDERFKLIDVTKQSVGWYIDATQTKINPETIMALCYIPVYAKSYNDKDDDGNPKHDLFEREKIMMDADLIDYFALNAFFLKKWNLLAKHVEMMKKIEQAKKKKLKYLFRRG